MSEEKHRPVDRPALKLLFCFLKYFSFLFPRASFVSHLVILHSQFRSLCAEQKGFGLLEVFQFKAELGLVDQDLGHALWIVALGHPLCVGPVLVVHVPSVQQTQGCA